MSLGPQFSIYREFTDLEILRSKLEINIMIIEIGYHDLDDPKIQILR